MKKWEKIVGVVILLVVLIWGTNSTAWAGCVGSSCGPTVVNTDGSNIGYVNDSTGVFERGANGGVINNNNPAGGFVGQIYGQGNISGYYSVKYQKDGTACPAGETCYHHIGTGVNGGAGRLAKERVCRPLPIKLDCPPDLKPDFSGPLINQCSGCGESVNYDRNSERIINHNNQGCGADRWLQGEQSWSGHHVDRTDKCVPKCPVGTKVVPTLGFGGCVVYDQTGGCDDVRSSPPRGQCDKSGYRECWHFTGGYTCPTNAGTIQGRVYFDQTNTCLRL